MKLNQIFAITGKAGLYKVISAQKSPFIVEDLETKKRLPLFAREQVVSLGDISIYTNLGDTPLGEVLDSIYRLYEGKSLPLEEITTSAETLSEFMKKVLPNYDENRVRSGDMKKLAKWYNILVNAGFTSFGEEEKNVEEKQ